MIFQLMIAACVLILTAYVGLVAREAGRLAVRVKTAERAISSVKPMLDDWARMQNEVRDMRETLDRLPLDELQAAADYDKALMDGLENIANYSLSEAMKTRGDGG